MLCILLTKVSSVGIYNIKKFRYYCAYTPEMYWS